MNAHLTEQQLNAHVHQTLNDAQRETLDAHLSSCPTCRARLGELNILQQRMRRDLTAELKAVNVPLSLTFEAIVPQLKQRRSLVFRRVVVGMTAVVAATAAIIALVILTNTPRPAPISTASILTVNQAANSATLGANTSASGWFLAGTAPQNYETGIDRVVTPDGKSSGYISSTVPSSGGFGTWMQMFKADEYRGKRLRLSAYVKAKDIKDWAGLWMRVDGPENEVLSFDNMQNRPVRGTVDWQQVAIVLDVPQNSVDIAFGILLQGVGRVWIDNVQFEVVGQEVSTTQLKENTSPPLPQPINLGFEAGLNGWTPESTSQDYVIDVDSTVAHSGQASGYIRSQQADPAGMADLSQYVKADAYRGKRVHITEYIKFDGASTAARFAVYVFAPNNTTLQADSQPLYGTAQWQKHDTDLYVPENSDRIAYGIVLEGSGQVWIDDVQIETVDSQMLPAPADRTVEQQPTNLDFEAGSTGWSAADSNTQEYVSGVDSAVAHLGHASGSIEALGNQPNGLGLLRQSIKADEYRGKRVRISGYLTTGQLNGSASFLMTIYGQQDQMIYANSRSISSSPDWRWVGIVFDVPANSDRLEYGLALIGAGQAWLDDVRIEFVGNDAETSSFETSPLQYGFLGASRPDNLDFESGADLQAWSDSGNADYEEGIARLVFHTGTASAYVKSKGTVNTGSYDVLSQMIRADDYRGKRLRLSGYIKANQVGGWAGLWMNIASSSYQLLGLDNMQNRPITGTTDWQKYEIVLDIPEDGATIGFGVLLQGEGEIWLDDVNLEVVGQDVPTTNPYQQQPLNLDFENSK